MADRFPLIANSSSNQIQELASGDTLDLTGNNVDNAVNVKATGIVTFSNATDSTSSTTGAVIISGGVGIAKSLFVGNNVTIGGTVTYEDVTNVDSVGIITAQTGVIVTAGRGLQVTAGGLNVDAGIGTFDAGLKVPGGELTVGAAVTVGTAGIVTAKAFVPTVGQLSHRNIVSNGAMRIAQRGSSSTSSGFKAMDRFRMSASNASHTLTQSQTAITSGSPYNEGFRYVFKILNAGQDAHTSAECSIMHTIEAQDIANSGWNYTSASSYVTLSFWVKSSVTQTHLLTLHTNDTVTKEYNHLISLTADAWTKVTLVIPGHADIVMNDDNGTGLQIIMYGALGTAYTSGSTVDQWVTHSGYTSRPDMGQTWWTTDNSTLEYTGVQLEVGTAATPFEHRSYHDDLIACQRYYYHLVAGSNEFFPVIGMADVDGNTIVLNTPFSVVMRTAPTAVEQSGTAGDYKIRRSTTQTCTSVPTFVHATLNQAVTNFTKSSHGWGDGSAVRCMGANASAFLAWSAEI